MHDFTWFTTEPIKKSWRYDKKGGGVGKVFQDMDVGEIQELINTTTKELTEDLMEMSGSQSVPDD